MRGDDDRLALGQAQIRRSALHERQDVVVDLDAQVAAGDHHRVGGLDDALQVAQAALVLDLGDDARLGAEAVEQRPQHQHVVAPADERERDEVDARVDAGADVALVLLGERRQVDVDAGQVDVPARAELARREHAAADVRRVLLDHFQPDQAAVDQDGGADADVAPASPG